MPTGAEWKEHFRHLSSRRITRMRSALQVLLDDSMFDEHYHEMYVMDSLLRDVQWERQKARKR